MSERTIRIALAAFAVALLLAIGPTPAAQDGHANVPPTAGRALCLECHSDFADTLAGQVVHLPVEDGCTDCHSPHAARFAKLLRAETEDLCRECHGDVVEADPARVLHGALRDERSCLACHEPHAAEHSGLLRGGQGSLCLECHGTLAERLQSATTTHMPAADGDCSSCHVPHAGDDTRLLAEPVPGLCVLCHDPDDALRAKHGDFALDDADCASCHDPHGSSAAALVRPIVHFPFEEGDCAVCHADPAQPTSLQMPQTELCILCHDDRDPTAAKNSHPVAHDVACSSCHSPHAGDAPGMMRGAQRTLCLDCHTEIRRAVDHAESTHPISVEGGRCSACHQPHDAGAPSLLAGAPAELCVGCHETHARFAHPMGANVPDPSRPGRSLDCLSCHNPHASGYKHLMLASPDRALCIRCHQQLH